MRKSSIAGVSLGALLLAGVVVMNWPTAETEGTSTEALARGEGLVSAAQASSPSSTPIDSAGISEDTSGTEKAPVVASIVPSPSRTATPPSKATSGIAVSSSAAKEPTLPAATPIPPRPVTKDVSVGRGDTLMALLTRADVPRTEAHGVVTALKPVYDLRRMPIGQSFTLVLAPGPTPGPTPGETPRQDLWQDGPTRVVEPVVQAQR